MLDYTTKRKGKERIRLIFAERLEPSKKNAYARKREITYDKSFLRLLFSAGTAMRSTKRGEKWRQGALAKVQVSFFLEKELRKDKGLGWGTANGKLTKHNKLCGKRAVRRTRNEPVATCVSHEVAITPRRDNNLH